MITDKQRQRDYEYNGDYQTGSRYSKDQWVNIIKAGQIGDKELSYIKEIYSSFNHAASLLQLSFHQKTTAEAALTLMDQWAEGLGKANDYQPETDFSGRDFWWYLCFWGKETKEKGLEWKLQPELSEAIAELYPELEEQYYAYANDIERSMQVRYTPEDSVWIASAVLLYEKYYLNPGIRPDDILLMQYEIQQKAQKVYGQDVSFNTITKTCNADERGHHFNYLRDIYKYYRVTFPGECNGDLERPDPENVDYHAYVESVFGYMTLDTLYDFISHEYSYLVDESYIEITQANGFVRLATFLSRKGGQSYDSKDHSDPNIALKADGLDAETTFHMIGDSLIKEYPNFTYVKKAGWLTSDESQIQSQLQDILSIPAYSYTGASISVSTITEGDSVHIETGLNLPVVDDEELMLDIQDKCNMLTLMTAAPFVLTTVPADPSDLIPEGYKLRASVRYACQEVQTMKEGDIIDLMTTSLQIFASYYTDICQNYYPDEEEELSVADSFAAALGDKFKLRPSQNVAGPQVIYKQGTTSPTADFIVHALQNTIGGQNEGGSSSAGSDSSFGEEEEFTTVGTHIGKKINLLDEEEGVVQKITDTSTIIVPETEVQSAENMAEKKSQTSSERRSRRGSSASTDPGNTSGLSQAGQTGMAFHAATTGSAPAFNSPSSGPGGAGMAPAYAMLQAPIRPKVNRSEHADRKDQSFRSYPKNTLIQGPMKTAKFHQAMLTAVGIIEGKDADMMSIEPFSDVLEHFKQYEESHRILHISYPDANQNGYDSWIESNTNPVQDGIFKEFAHSCKDGRYVVVMEDVDLNWTKLFGETAVLLRDNRREGTSSETEITLSRSGEAFRLPSNLYIVATCDSIVCEDTILTAINQDFFIRQIAPDAGILKGMRVEGILLDRLMATLNLRISYFLGPKYQIGEGFFLGTADKDPFISLCRVFREQIIPILETWFDGDIERIRYVLGDNGKLRKETIFYRETPYASGLFRGTMPDDFDTERHIYQINEDAFYNPKSYIGIYE